MKKRYIALIIIGVIVLSLGSVIGFITTNGHYFTSSDDIKDYKNNNWMSFISDDTKLNDVIMPGSHDAGSYNINYLGRTQGYNIKSQLDMGTRYFDLRVHKNEDNYYLYHAYFDGEKFDDALSTLTTFIKENKEETLILDFQHFKGDSEKDVIEKIDNVLVKENLVIKNTTSLSDLKYISNLTINDTRGKCVILFGNNSLANEYNYLFSRNNDDCEYEGRVLNSCYIDDLHFQNSEVFIEEAIPLYYQNIKDKIREEKYKGLFVLQSQLTDGNLIFGPYSREKTHDKNITDYIQNIKNDEEKLMLTNIIMRDFLTMNKCENIIALNYYKNNVKEEMKNSFLNVYN